MEQALLPLLACALLCSCSGNNTASTQLETTSVDTETSLTTSAVTSVENPANNAPYVDENGLLTDSGKRRIAELSDNAYTGLFDFDGDGVPEVYTVPEKNTEKPVTCSLFRLETGEIIGEFYGCAGSRFSRGDGCVYVHNFIETSDSRYEDVQRIVMSEDGLSSARILENEAKTSNGQLNNSYYIGGNMPADMEAYTAEFVKWQTIGHIRRHLSALCKVLTKFNLPA